MPRVCKICHEAFPSASKLAEHLKFSNCSNYRTIIKCPYCDRDDFVDEDSLNRHLSHNRQCSRADIEATDKLSMLLPDRGGKHQKFAHHHNTPSMRFPNNDMDVTSQLQGNLVNYVNAFHLHHLHNVQTSLCGPVSQVFQKGKDIVVVIHEDDPAMQHLLQNGNKSVMNTDKQEHIHHE